MDALDLARWQFAITTVYHFLFVPITIGLSGIVATFQLIWFKTDNPAYLRLTKFFGKLFLINFALGLVTGIVQEFQFGMNWSDYSRFVGDIFGAPLAIEALLAFFLESVFLGLWIFGWDRLPRPIHAASIWAVHIGTILSAYFILAANSWMQNPVGYAVNPVTHRAELNDFVAVLTNKVQLVTFPHTVTAAYMVGGAFVMGVSLWLAMRASRPGHEDAADVPMYRKSTRIGAWVTLVASLLVMFTGDLQAKTMTEVQPMKMAAAEALWETADSHAPFSLFTVGSLDGSEERFAITVPGLLSFLATGSVDGQVRGINDLQAEYREKYASDPGSLTYATSYAPTIPLAYWSFRLMIGAGGIATLISLAVLWWTRKGRVPVGRWWVWAAVAAPMLPVFANSFGWIFTETGRQPWLVFGLMTTATGVSPSVPMSNVVLSLVVLTLLYGALAVVEIGLLLKYIKKGADPYEEPVDPANRDEDAPLVFAY